MQIWHVIVETSPKCRLYERLSEETEPVSALWRGGDRDEFCLVKCILNVNFVYIHTHCNYNVAFMCSCVSWTNLQGREKQLINKFDLLSVLYEEESSDVRLVLGITVINQTVIQCFSKKVRPWNSAYNWDK